MTNIRIFSGTISFMLLWVMLLNTSALRAQTPPTAADVLLGSWTNGDQTRVIEMTRVGDTYEAIVRKGPDSSMIGQKQVTGLKYDGGSYTGGKIYHPRRKKYYSCTVKMEGNDAIQLTARAGLIRRSQTWTRVK